jgi:hypothetical protein
MIMRYRDLVICKCGRAAMLDSPICRTCYEDGFRRRWREDSLRVDRDGKPVPAIPLTPRQRIYSAPDPLHGRRRLRTTMAEVAGR